MTDTNDENALVALSAGVFDSKVTHASLSVVKGGYAFRIGASSERARAVFPLVKGEKTHIRWQVQLGTGKVTLVVGGSTILDEQQFVDLTSAPPTLFSRCNRGSKHFRRASRHREVRQLHAQDQVSAPSQSAAERVNRGARRRAHVGDPAVRPRCRFCCSLHMHRCAALAVIVLEGCGWSSRGPVDLNKVETRAVHFGLASPRSAICPGEPVALHVLLDVVEPGSDGPPQRLVPHRHELDDAIFDVRQLHLSSPNGTFDKEGTFFPSPDVLASAQSGFVIYTRPPSGPAFSVRFPPSYECRRTVGRPGTAGHAGSVGDHALYSDDDQSLAQRVRAADGRLGAEGGPGGTGPTLTVFVTWVRTPDYTRLLAARASVDDDHLTLAAPGTPLEVIARGGPGGAGGRGGDGAPSVSPYLPGGAGGMGGRGGEGGHGGFVTVVLDDRFDDLERLVSIDARGGQGGSGGAPGVGGRSIEGQSAATRGAGYAERDGIISPAGSPGKQGPAGDRGQVVVTRGKVAEHFENLGAIVPL